MAHWGWYWRVKKKHIPRTTIDASLPVLDSFKIFKTTIAGFTVEPLNIRVMLAGDQLHVWYGKSAKPSYAIQVEKQSCNFGGFRTFFHCPLCQKRMRMLYFVQRSIFSCRKCLNLCYETQRLRPSRRHTYTRNKIEALLKNKGGSVDGKPPHMHDTTYERLMSKHEYHQDKWHQAYNDDLRAWFGPKVASHIGEFFDYVDESKPWRKNKQSRQAVKNAGATV